jgi:hypothetical protein
MSGDWLNGDGGSYRNMTPAYWQPGTARRPMEAICCTACGSVNVAVRDNAKSESYDRWECHDCKNSWKERRDLKPKRGYGFAP